MELNALIDEIVKLEWPMFHQVNGEDRTDCQNDYPTFHAMRSAQFSAWSVRAAECWLADLRAAEQAGRNLVREKYIWMMERTDPAGFERFKGELPALTEEQERLIAALWAKFLPQTQALRQEYPAIALGGRPLLSRDEQGDETSIETYQTGEWKTFSAATLAALLEHTQALEDQGVSLVRQIQERSVFAMGFSTMDDAERAISYQLLQQMGGGECTSCQCHFH